MHLYGIELYANTYAVHLDKLMKVNIKILRILQNKPVLTPTSELYTAYTLSCNCRIASAANINSGAKVSVFLR